MRRPFSSPTTPSAASPQHAAERQRNRLVVVLAVASGASDAIGFLALGNVFTSVMTGNLVLFGVALARRDGAALGLTACAILSFIAGAGIGARVAGTPREDDSFWPAQVSRALCIELCLFAVFAATWWLLDSHPDRDWLLPLLAINALALGLQSSAIQRLGVSGLSTTYLTGTLTSVVIRLTSGRGIKHVAPSLTILLGLIAGAGIGALLLELVPAAVPSIQLATVAVVLTWARFSPRLRHPRQRSCKRVAAPDARGRPAGP
ncbi:YoaK family protein [Pseudonocardia sp. T1-2H]|uniref:YoaK family protein n=1 Tax=Pseudonocardia sp. T1-2H TaxID=3128899 RepID=UPI003100D42E